MWVALSCVSHVMSGWTCMHQSGYLRGRSALRMTLCACMYVYAWLEKRSFLSSPTEAANRVLIFLLRPFPFLPRPSQEKHRQLTSLELIASENFTSAAVMECLGSVLTNKVRRRSLL